MCSDSRTSLLALLGLLALAASGASGQTVSGSVRNGGVHMPEAAVYLIPLEGGEQLAPPTNAVVDQVHLRFVPSVVVVSPGSDVTFLNGDPQLHNVFSPGTDEDGGFDLGTYDQSDARSRRFDEEGLHVILCHIHPEMAAYVIVTSAPFRAITNADGAFSLQDVPAGRYSLRAWHPRRWREQFEETITVPQGGLSDLTITLAPNRRGRSR